MFLNPPRGGNEKGLVQKSNWQPQLPVTQDATIDTSQSPRDYLVPTPGKRREAAEYARGATPRQNVAKQKLRDMLDSGAASALFNKVESHAAPVVRTYGAGSDYPQAEVRGDGSDMRNFRRR